MNNKRTKQTMLTGAICLAISLIVVLLTGCAFLSKSRSNGAITKAPFGKMPDVTPINIYALRNDNGMEVGIVIYGSTIQSIKVPDRYRDLSDVVLGYNSLHEYQTKSPYFGALIGRYANRIANGRFTLNGVTYHLTPPKARLAGCFC